MLLVRQLSALCPNPTNVRIRLSGWQLRLIKPVWLKTRILFRQLCSAQPTVVSWQVDCADDIEVVGDRGNGRADKG